MDTDKLYLFDGPMGTMLQSAGLPPGACPELWNIDRPAAVQAVHAAYVAAGADIIETNTFGANRIKLAHYGLTGQTAQLNIEAVRLARAAAGTAVRVAGSVGPTGELIQPLGQLGFDTAVAAFREQIAALVQAGVDMIIIETIIDLQEARAALIAARAITDIPVVCQMSFGPDGRTVTGTDAVTAAVVLSSLGASAVGANCSLGPEELLPVVRAIAAATSLPVSVQPNAGLPVLDGDRTVFPLSPEEFARWIPELVAAGATYLGACCGATPAHIAAARRAMAALSPGPRPAPAAGVALASRTRTVFAGPGHPPLLIGERINPTGRKAMAADLRAGNLGSIKKEALSQVAAGAKALDINLGVPGIDQAALMEQAVSELSGLVDVPLAIDTTDPKTLEAGLRLYPGRALVNSVSAEPDRLEAFLALAKRYGAAVLCLPLTAAGVPATAAERVSIIRTIIDAALAAGLKREDLLLDALVMTVAAAPDAARETLATLAAYRREFSLPAVIGLSNVSYGLPRRDLLNGTFLAMALAAGLDAVILNPYDPFLNDILAAANALSGYDPRGAAYAAAYALEAPGGVSARPASASPPDSADPVSALRAAIAAGHKEAVLALVDQAVAAGAAPEALTNLALTPAMQDVGDAFAAGRCFLPQVLLAAEALRAAFDHLKQLYPASSGPSLGTVVLATVKGDIHDLGKNIVGALLQNNGFSVIDLGKDVSPAQVVAAARDHKADIVGLSALMTTTLPGIDATIRALKEAGLSARIMVGGAVLTAEYAAKAGADGYAADALAALSLARKLVNAG